jgi:DNA-binding IclR family transcriptional regulator
VSKKLELVDHEAAEKASAGAAEVSERHEHLTELGVTGKAFSVLEVVSTNTDPTAIAEVIRVTGMSKPTAHRVVNLLVEMGYLERDASDRGFIEGANLVGLSHRTLAAAAPRSLRHSILESVSRHVGETCNYGVLSGAEVVYLDRVEAKWPLGLRFDAGSRVPAHCTAIGKLLLTYLADRELATVLDNVPRSSYTANTITEREPLVDALDAIRESGIGTDNQEFMHGVVCVAVPVRGARGDVYGGIAVSAPEARMTLEEMLEFVPCMTEAARSLASTYEVRETRNIRQRGAS